MLTTVRSTVAALSILLPVAALADEPANKNFKTDCVNAWMKSAPAEDKVEYQNFGEKYCACAATKPLNNQDDINKAAQTCMAQTLLRDVMDDVEENTGLDEATSEAIMTTCQDKWKTIYPQTSTDPSAPTNRYCQCTVPKLLEISKNNENYTDDQWYAQIDTISASCASTIIPEKEAGDVKKAP